MKKNLTKRGEMLYDNMCSINERLYAICSVLEAETSAAAALREQKHVACRRLQDCHEALERHVRVLPQLLPPKDTLRCSLLEQRISRVLEDIHSLVCGNVTFYSALAEMLRPLIDTLDGLMDEYVML